VVLVKEEIDMTRTIAALLLCLAGCSSKSSVLEGDASTSDGGTADGATAPTASTWLGVNISGDLPRVDITYQLVPFNTNGGAQDANGYPAAGVSGTSQTDIGYVLPTGAYNISYQGSGQLSVSGIGTLVGSWQSVGNEQRAVVTITGTPGTFGNFLTLTITNTGSQTVTDLHIYFPGFDYDSTETFLPQFLTLLGPFRAMRFMGWEATNSSTLVDWADRPAAAHFGQSQYGEPWEHIVELVNETGKDAWVNVPEHASDDYIHSLAQFLNTNLDLDRIAAARRAQGMTAPFQLIVENSNETWNQGFTAYQTFLTAANMDTELYTGVYAGTFGPSWMSESSDLMKVGQYEADRLVKIGNIFKQEFGANASMIAPVLSGWALGAVYSDVALQFIQTNYGDPKTYVTYVAQAPYFGPDDAQTGALDTLFASANTNVQAMDATFQDFAMLGQQYGIGIVAYEGGQGISGTTNQPLKHLAQHDQRMYDAYNAYFTLWQKDFGKSLFMHFALAETPGVPETIFQYGFWGSIISTLEDSQACRPDLPTLTGTESIPSVIHHCPKYRALAEQALQ
jgi:hypothetical protein